MASKTTNYGLNKHSPQDFYNVEARNENWDKIDAELKNNVDAVNARVKTAELAAEVKKVVKDGSLTASDLGAVSAADKGKAGGIAGLGADGKVPAVQLPEMNYESKGAVDTHNTSASAHNALFAAKQNKIKGKKGKFVGFTADNTVGEVDAPASGGSRITLTFASDFVGQAWTLKGGGETYTGTVDSSKTATVSVLGINTTYTLSAALSGTTYTTEVTTKAYYTALAVALEKFQSTITVTVDSGSTVTATLGSTILTKTSTGTAVFVVGKAGAWSIKATKDSNSASGTVTISKSGESKTLTLTYANVFGVVWDTSNRSTALKRLTQSTDPYGLVTKSVTTEPKPAGGAAIGSSPFDSFLPWSGMKECNLDYDGSVKAWKDDSGFSRTDPYVMVWIPEFYFATKTNGTKKYFYIADGPVSGMKKHPGSGKFIGRYVMDNNCGSTTGGAPLVNETRADARLSATVGGDKGGSKWHMYDFATYCAIIWLYIVEFADWNCQSKIGPGRTEQSEKSNNGRTDKMVYHTGKESTGNTPSVQYRWIENLWGNVSQWVDGFNANGTTAYYCTDPSKYADDVATGYTKIGNLPKVSGYIKDLTVLDNGLFIPKSNGGSDTTYIPDIVASNTDGKYGLMVGGCYGENNDAGLLYFNAANSGTDSFSTTSARLMCEV